MQTIYNDKMELGKIVKDIISLRRKLGGLEAKRVPGVPYAVKSAKELMSKVREAADDLQMLLVGAPVDVRMTHEATDKGTKVHVTGTYRFMSDDGTYIDYMGVGSGIATDDKAAGKASTYAWKEAMVKALSLPDAELVDTDDEVLSPVVFDLITDIQACKTETELKTLRPRLQELESYEKEHVTPIYIKTAALVKGK